MPIVGYLYIGKMTSWCLKDCSSPISENENNVFEYFVYLTLNVTVSTIWSVVIFDYQENKDHEIFNYSTFKKIIGHYSQAELKINDTNNTISGATDSV